VSPKQEKRKILRAKKRRSGWQDADGTGGTGHTKTTWMFRTANLNLFSDI